MGFSVLPLIACALFASGWAAVAVCHFRSETRRDRERAEWARLAQRVAGLTELDADLDRAWGDEQERIRRYR